MIQRVYIDKGMPFAWVASETLTDGSVAWNLHFRGTESGHRDSDMIPCASEKRADEAFILIAAALHAATGEKPLIL